MGYKNTINSNVDKAFKLLKDIVVQVTLSSKSDTGFDFTSNAPSNVVTTSKPMQAIPITTKRPSSDKTISTLQHSFLIKAKDLPEPTIYDTITVVNGPVWKVTAPFENDGYLVTAQVAREA